MTFLIYFRSPNADSCKRHTRNHHAQRCDTGECAQETWADEAGRQATEEGWLAGETEARGKRGKRWEGE